MGAPVELSSLIYPAGNRQQPSGVVRVNLDRWPSLRMLYIGGQYVLHGRNGVIIPTIDSLTGNPTFVGANGITSEFWPNSTGQSNTIRSLIDPVSSARSLDFTAMVEYAQQDTYSVYDDLSITVGHGDWSRLRMSYTGAMVNFVDSSLNDRSATVNFATTGFNIFHRAVGRHKAQDLQVFCESGSSSVTTTSGALYSPASLHNRLVGNKGRGYCSVAAFFDSALDDYDVASLIDNPWVLVEPPLSRLYFDFGASSAITLTSLTMSNFTSSGARATLGITR